MVDLEGRLEAVRRVRRTGDHLQPGVEGVGVDVESS